MPGAGDALGTSAFDVANRDGETTIAVVQHFGSLPEELVVIVAPPGDNIHHWELLATYLVANDMAAVRLECPNPGRAKGRLSSVETLAAFEEHVVEGIYSIRATFPQARLGVVAPCLGGRVVLRAAKRLASLVEFVGTVTGVVELEAAFEATLPPDERRFWAWAVASPFGGPSLRHVNLRLPIFRELCTGWERASTTADDIRAAGLSVFDIHVEDDPLAPTAAVLRHLQAEGGRVVQVPNVVHDRTIAVQPAVLAATAGACLDAFAMRHRYRPPTVELVRDMHLVERRLARSLGSEAWLWATPKHGNDTDGRRLNDLATTGEEGPQIDMQRIPQHTGMRTDVPNTPAPTVSFTLGTLGLTEGAAPVVEAALERGIGRIDVVPEYDGGIGEHTIGRSPGIRAGQALIETALPEWLSPLDEDGYRASVDQWLDASRRRLGRPPDEVSVTVSDQHPATAPLVRCIGRLVETKAICGYSLRTDSVLQLARWLWTAEELGVANPSRFKFGHHFLHISAWPAIDACRELGLPIAAFSILGGGTLLASVERVEPHWRAVAEFITPLLEVARDLRVSFGQLAAAWTVATTGACEIVVAPKSTAQLEDFEPDLIPLDQSVLAHITTVTAAAGTTWGLALQASVHNP